MSCFERKTVRDFKISIVDGRLFSQASRMVSTLYRPVYIIESDTGYAATPDVRRESLQGALITLSIILGIPVLGSRDVHVTAWLIYHTTDQVQRSIRGAIQRPGYRPRGKRRSQLYILQSLPEVGPKRAKLLLGHFGTIEPVMSADVSALSDVAGIGKPIVEKIVNVVRETTMPYGVALDNDLFDL